MAAPVVIDAWRNREYVFDLYSRMLRDRIIVLDTVIEDWTATMITSQLLFLEQENPWREIALYINSPGGLISAGLAIYDAMQFISCPVATGSSVLTAAQPDNDPSATWRVCRAGVRHTDPRTGNQPLERFADRYPFPALRYAKGRFGAHAG